MNIVESLRINAKNEGELIARLKNSRKKLEPDMDSIMMQIDPHYHDVMRKDKRPDKQIKVEDEEGRSVVKIEKVGRVAVALQKRIVNSSVSFLFGNDVEYTSDTEDEKQNEVLQSIKSVMVDVCERSHNRALARELFTSTESAEVWYVVDSGEKHTRYGFETTMRIKVQQFKPTKGDALFPYFDQDGNLLAFSRQFTDIDNEQKRHTYFETYTNDAHYVWEVGTGSDIQLVDGYPEKIALGKMPIVFVSQDNTEWYDVQPLIDRLETLLSNFADINDYHASPKIVVKGEIQGWASKGESGQIIEMDTEGSAEYLTWQQATASVDSEVNNLYKLIYSLTQTPDISFSAVQGLNVSGLSLKMLFMDAHLKVQDKIEIFGQALRRRANIVKKLLSMINAKDSAFVDACNSINIDAETRPYIITDEASEVATYASACGNKAVMSRKTAVQRLGYVADIEAELKQIEEEEQAALGMISIDNLAY